MWHEWISLSGKLESTWLCSTWSITNSAGFSWHAGIVQPTAKGSTPMCGSHIVGTLAANASWSYALHRGVERRRSHEPQVILWLVQSKAIAHLPDENINTCYTFMFPFTVDHTVQSIGNLSTCSCSWQVLKCELSALVLALMVDRTIQH